MARPNQSLKTLAKPLTSLLISAFEEMDRCLESSDVPESRDCYSIDPVALDSIYEKLGYVLNDACFGGTFYVIPYYGHLVSPCAIRMCISDYAEHECCTLYLCRAATELEFTFNLLAQVAGADVERVTNGRLTDTEWDRLKPGVERLVTLDFSVLQTQQLSLPMLGNWLEEVAEQSKRRSLVVIDDELLIAKRRRSSLTSMIDLSAKYDAAIALVAQIPTN
ncbi:MAG: hypothetical protein NTV11_15940 [Rhodocyclales bacterium]|nr:hypothetical protein [Rhodocyclales bacterium]